TERLNNNPSILTSSTAENLTAFRRTRLAAIFAENPSGRVPDFTLKKRAPLAGNTGTSSSHTTEKTTTSPWYLPCQ
ncbi:hypothetical protein NDU88_003316, partial [Pleurodeles waltl]